VAGPEAAAELAVAAACHDGLRFDGFLTYPAPSGALDFLTAAVAAAKQRGLDAAVGSAAGADRLELGQRVRIVPNHAWVVVNLFDELQVTRNARVETSWRVAARGHSQ
jgi:D-serine deaminase-like pyridoxal phosphate-dependent protein